MLQDSLTLYKLIVLYMLNRVSFPLTAAQVSNFILEKEITDFLTLQQVLNELIDTLLISSKTIRNRTLLSITDEGQKTLEYFKNRINWGLRRDIDDYFQENEYALRNETSIQADYYKATSGDYEAHLVAKERDANLVEITLSVPTSKLADAICDNWLKKNEEIYEYLIEQLF